MLHIHVLSCFSFRNYSFISGGVNVVVMPDILFIFIVTNGHAAYTNGIHQPTSLAAKNLRTLLQQQLNEIQAAGTLKTECIITTPQNAVIGIEESIKPVVNFCSNNYLGMAVSIIPLFFGTIFHVNFYSFEELSIFKDNPDVIEHAKKMMDEYGSGLSSARFICGTQSIHRVSI